MPTNSLFQNRWWIPFAGCLGIMVGIASVLVTVVLLAVLGPYTYPQRREAKIAVAAAE